MFFNGHSFTTFSYFDKNENIYKTKKYTGSEECVVDNVKLCGTFNTDSKDTACITLRVPVRNIMQSCSALDRRIIYVRFFSHSEKSNGRR